jgi:DNA polymerase I-like protein with 3'-5' exonuclease and polymerase domains
MRVIKTSELTKDSIGDFSNDEVLWIYNGLDCLVTHEIYGILKEQLDPKDTLVTYEFERSLQSPIFDIMSRGFKVDTEAKEKVRQDIIQRLRDLSGMEKVGVGKWKITNPEALIQELAYAIWDKPINPCVTPSCAFAI